jgi:hypothetical protein
MTLGPCPACGGDTCVKVASDYTFALVRKLEEEMRAWLDKRKCYVHRDYDDLRARVRAALQEKP